MKYAAFLLLACVPAPVLAQASDPHAGHHMPGMAMPGDNADDTDQADAPQPVGTDQDPGSAEAPKPAHDRAADRFFDPAAMARAEAEMMRPPVTTFARGGFDLAEYQFRNGQDGYRWEGEAWVGDLHRLVLKSQGEGTFGEPIDHAEAQVVYARALDPWWTAQAGVRQDFGPGPQRTWATLGIEGRAPYQFDMDGALFLSDKGQLTARIEAAYDERVTQRLVLQPRAELNLSAQDMAQQRTGSGVTSVELGVRLRYEIRRQLAPYLGFSWTRMTGRTADYTRADGEKASAASVVAGVRFWL